MTDTLTVPIDEVSDSAGRSIILSGSGALHDMIRSELDIRRKHSAPPSTVDASAGCAVIVVVGDEPTGPGAVAVPWLPVWWEAGHVLLGPARLPGVPGCRTCAERRRRRNQPDRANHDAVRERFGAELGWRGPGLLGGITAALLAELVDTEATSLACDPRWARTCNGMLKVAVETARISWHRVLPDPLCPDCSALPPDTPEAAQIVLTPIRKRTPNSFRVRDAVAVQPALERLYSNSETGVIAQVSTGVSGGCPISVAQLEPVTAQGASQSGCGRTLNLRAARLSALTEALERYASRAPARARRTTVRARYVDIADRAVDPTRFGLFPNERYDLPEFPYRRYHPELELPWVWGYSFAREEPVLVPQNLVYYARGPGVGAEDFVYEISSGCALGGCLTEAIFHGLLEITERDAFLITWYARLPAPRVDLDSAVDRSIPLLAERARQTLGYDIRAFDITLEHGIPSFWVLAVDSQHSPSRLTTLCAANAHPLPEQALLGALCELASLLGGLLAEYSDQDSTALATPLLADPDAVRTMDDHSLLYFHPDAFDRLAFLPIDGPAQSLTNLSPKWRWPAHSDLTADLSELIRRYLDTNLDVIVVNQTAPEHQAGGLSCVKVLVPGTLPMTFGHRFRRTDGIPRLLSVPRLLGYHLCDLRPDEINPYPHPFP